MPNPVDGSTTIDLDRKRTLRFDFNAIVALEEQTGRSLLKGDLFDLGSAKDVRALLYAGLCGDDPSLTPEATGRLIDLRNMQRISETIGEAIRMALPQPDEDGPEGNVTALPAPRKARSTG